jgi:hypothetical protein
MRLATAVSRSKMRGVFCRRCNKTVPLTASFAERESTFKVRRARRATRVAFQSLSASVQVMRSRNHLQLGRGQ